MGTKRKKAARAQAEAPEDGGCSNPHCPRHAPFTARLEAFMVAAELQARMGRPELDAERRLWAWDASTEDGGDGLVEMALVDGRPVLRVHGDTERTQGVIGLCLSKGIACLDTDGDPIIGDKPDPDPWAEADAEREARREAMHAVGAGMAERLRHVVAEQHGVDPEDVKVLGPGLGGVDKGKLN